MADVTGSLCGLCAKPIPSIFDGVFCSECGSPYHHSCFNGPPSKRVANRCDYCGGAPGLSSPQGAPNKYVETVNNYAADQMRQGVEPAAIEKKLVKQGHDPDAAAVILFNLQRAQALKKAGQKNMMFGA